MTRTFASRVALAAALGLAAVLTVAAPAAAETYTKEHLAAARAAIDASHVSDGFDNVLVVVAEQTKTFFIRANPAISTQVEDATNKVAIALAARRPELDHEIQQIWCSKFSQAELQDIAKFYTSPLGQKLAKETTNMVQASVRVVQIYQQKLSQDMVAQVREELKKKGLPF
jgi:uncharacterized protein